MRGHVRSLIANQLHVCVLSKLCYVTRMRQRHHLDLTSTTPHSLTNNKVYMRAGKTQTHAVNDMIAPDSKGGRLVMSCFPLARTFIIFLFLGERDNLC